MLNDNINNTAIAATISCIVSLQWFIVIFTVIGIFIAIVIFIVIVSFFVIMTFREGGP